MKTVQELYKEIMASEELKKGFVEAAKAGKQMDFIKEHGCEASAEEIEAFLKGQAEADKTLSADELENVAGGCSTKDRRIVVSVFGLGVVCVAIPIASAGSGKTKEILC